MSAIDSVPVTVPVATTSADDLVTAFLTAGRRHRRFRAVAGRVAIAVALVLGTWYALPPLGVVERVFLPAPHDVLGRLIELVQTASLWENARATASVALWGYAVAIAIGLTSGVLLGTVPFLGRALAPYLGALQALPKVVFAPLLITWLGFGNESKVATAAIVAMLPIVIDTMVGLQSCSDDAVKLLRSYRTSRWRTFWLLRVPASLPLVFVGLRQALLLSLAGTLLAEALIGSSEGLGHLVELYNGQILMDRAYAVVVVVACIALVVSVLLAWLERRIIYWRGHELT